MVLPFAHSPTARSLDRFMSGGSEIRIESFGEMGSESTPSIVVLHGATGIEYANRFIATLAQAIAQFGFVVHLVHYFDRTGEAYADDKAIRRSSSAWLDTVEDAVSFVHLQRPSAKIGVFGYSLGGYLAAAAAVRNAYIGAAVILAGGIDPDSARRAAHVPPFLVLHGSIDTRVPVTEAHSLAEILTGLGRLPEIHIYPGEGHFMKALTYANVIDRSSKFFRSSLS